MGTEIFSITMANYSLVDGQVPHPTVAIAHDRATAERIALGELGGLVDDVTLDDPRLEIVVKDPEGIEIGIRFFNEALTKVLKTVTIKWHVA